MKNLTEYLKEISDDNTIMRAHEILESKFDSTSWNHYDNYLYAQAIVNDLLNNVPVKSFFGDDFRKADFDETKLLVLQQKLSSDPKETKAIDLNDAYIGKYIDRYKIKSNGKPDKTLFYDIQKSYYSGKIHTEGVMAESLVCYLFNKGNIDDNFNEFNNKSNANLNESYKKSSIAIVECINKNGWYNTEYVAVCINSNQVDDIDQKYEDFAKIFKSKKKAKKVLGYDVSDLYTGKKDKWNPADILLIKKNDADNSLKELKDVTEDKNNNGNNGELLNNYLGVLCIDEKVIPISLKMCNKPKIHFINKGELISEYDINNVTISLASRYVDDKINGTIYIYLGSDDSLPHIQIRSQNKNYNNISIEAKNSKNTARMGKGIDVIKRSLNLTGNSYYVDLNSNEELVKEFKNYGFDIKIDNHDHQQLYNKTCFRGLLGILKKYKEKHKNDYTKEKFGEFLLMSCVVCPSTYYIISD
jgi:hypothetical protein